MGLKKGDRVRVSKSWKNHYWTPDSAGYVCIVIADGPYRCARRHCHPNCRGQAEFVRTLRLEARYKRKVKAWGNRKWGFAWNHDANKVCTAYLEKV